MLQTILPCMEQGCRGVEMQGCRLQTTWPSVGQGCWGAGMRGCGDAGMQAANHLALIGAVAEARQGSPVSGGCGVCSGLWERGRPPSAPTPPTPATPRLQAWSSAPSAGSGERGFGAAGGEALPAAPVATEGWAKRQRPPSLHGSNRPRPPFPTEDAVTSPPHKCSLRGVQHPTFFPPGEGGKTCLCSPAFPQRLFSSRGSQ